MQHSQPLPRLTAAVILLTRWYIYNCRNTTVRIVEVFPQGNPNLFLGMIHKICYIL